MLRYGTNCFWLGRASGGRRRCAAEEYAAAPVGVPEARSSIQGVGAFPGREAGEGLRRGSPEGRTGLQASEGILSNEGQVREFAHSS